MKKILYLLIFLSPHAHATQLWMGVEYGKGFYTLDSSTTETKNQIWGINTYLPINSWFKTGLGYQQQTLSLSYSQGMYQNADLVSKNFYVALTPYWQLNSHLDLSFDNRILLNDPLQTNIDASQRFFSGLSMGYEFIPDYKVQLSLSHGLDFSNSTTLALISFSFNLNSTKKTSVNKNIPTELKMAVADKPHFDTNLPPVQITPPKTAQEMTKLGSIAGNFNYKQATTPNSPWLNQLIPLLQNSQVSDILLIGHTDQKGSQEYNLTLGQQRADFIKQYLKNQGITTNIRVESKGKLEPISQQDDVNRRVEIFIDVDKSNPQNQDLVKFLERGSHEP